MNRIGSFVIVLLSMTLQTTEAAGQPIAEVRQEPMALKTEVSRLDLEQARVAQSGDVQAMSALLHPDYTAHVANGRVVNRAETLKFVASGSLARERFERTQESVNVAGSTGVVMGLDRLEAPPPLATRGERSRRYTNVYVMHQGRWKLFARHFHLLP